MLITLAESVEHSRLLDIRGRVTRVAGTIIHAAVPRVSIGELCLLRNPGQDSELKAEVVGLAGRETLLTPISP